MKTNLDFINYILENYPEIDVIDYSNNCVLGYNMKNNKAYYLYEVNEDVSFCFHLLCEIGESYRMWFVDTIEKNRCKVETKETEIDYYEIIYKC